MKQFEAVFEWSYNLINTLFTGVPVPNAIVASIGSGPMVIGADDGQRRPHATSRKQHSLKCGSQPVDFRVLTPQNWSHGRSPFVGVGRVLTHVMDGYRPALVEIYSYVYSFQYRKQKYSLQF